MKGVFTFTLIELVCIAATAFAQSQIENGWEQSLEASMIDESTGKPIRGTKIVHLIEVTPDKEIVWDFYSPFVGQGFHHLGKRIHRATRYATEYVQPLLQARRDRIVSEIDRDGQRIKTYADLIRLYQSQ